MNKLHLLLVTGMLVLAAGCATEESVIEPPSKSTLGEKAYEQSPALNKDLNKSSTSVVTPVSDTLSFEDALSKALLENPRLQSYGWRMRIKEAKRIQASLLPNPKLEAEMENFGGTEQFADLDNREITIRLSQKILLGADRLKQKRLADANKQLAGWDYETRRLEVLTGATKAYISALEAQKQWQQQKELVKIAQKVFESIAAQVEAGKVSKLIQTKANVELSRARIDLDRARNTFESARSNLASFWGSHKPQFQRLSGKLSSPQPLPDYQALTTFIERNPDVARWQAKIQQREANLDLQRAKGIPDLNITGGYKRFEGIGAEAAVVGVSIPLPIFDRNQGAIKAAKYRLNKADAQRRAALTEVNRALRQAYNHLQSAHHEVQQLKEKVLPGAREAFEASQIGYRRGKFDYLEVLDAQRTLFASRTRHIQALAEYHRNLAEVERLIGTPLSEITPN